MNKNDSCVEQNITTGVIKFPNDISLPQNSNGFQNIIVEKLRTWSMIRKTRKILREARKNQPEQNTYI